MAVSTKVFAHFLQDATGGTGAGTSPNCDWLSDTIKIALVTVLPNQATDEFWTTPQANEVSGAAPGYSTGGITLTGKTLAASSLVSTYDSSLDPTWNTATFSAVAAVIYDSTPGTAATDPLIAYIDFGGTLSPSSGTLVITFNASGIFTVTVS